MNAKQLIEALSKIDPEVIVYWTDWDSEFDIMHVTVVSGVMGDGCLDADYREDHPNMLEIQTRWKEAGE